MKLTAKQEGFVLSILEGKTQAEAYRENYGCKNMSDNAVYVEASRLMENPNVSLRIKELRNEASEKSQWTVERLIKEFEALKRKCMQEIPVLDKEGNCTGEYVFKENGVIKALENIGKLCGHYTEKIEHSGTVDFDIKKLQKYLKE